MLTAGLELVLSHTEKSCIASNYRQFSMNIKIKIIKARANKTGFNPIIFHFDIRGKLSIIRCDKYSFRQLKITANIYLSHRIIAFRGYQNEKL